VQPFTPALELLRHLIVGAPLADPAWVAIVKLVGFAGVLLPAAMLFLGLAIRTAQRRGTIIEY
jgi:ABC-2 type transport system permease protein